MRNIYDIRKEKQLQFIFSTEHSQFVPSQDLLRSCAVVVNLYYTEKIKWYSTYFNRLPEEITLYIFSSKEEALEQAGQYCSHKNTCIIKKENRGWDISALLVAFRPHIDQYATSKVGTDLLGRYYVEAYGMTVMTTRMFTHTGPRRGDVFHESTFAKQIAMIEDGLIEPKVMVGNLKSLRTYADVRDTVKAYYLLVTVNPVAGEYYNIGGTYTCEVGDTFETLLSYSAMRGKIKVECDPNRLRPIDADLQVPDCSKLKKHTGWEPKITFGDTMKDLLEY